VQKVFPIDLPISVVMVSHWMRSVGFGLVLGKNAVLVSFVCLPAVACLRCNKYYVTGHAISPCIINTSVAVIIASMSDVI